MTILTKMIVFRNDFILKVLSQKGYSNKIYDFCKDGHFSEDAYVRFFLIWTLMDGNFCEYAHGWSF